MTETKLAYIGDELTIFALATNWKRYLRRRIGPYLKGAVAEVGAGQGATTKALGGLPSVSAWWAIEPDPDMAVMLNKACEAGEFAAGTTIRSGTLADVPPDMLFDTIIYIDVLEHIEDDRGELSVAAARLRPGGSIVVLSPAWQFLYSPFDKAIGHYRRYTKSSLRAVGPPLLRERSAFYVDSIGFFGSLANKLIFKQDMPNEKQVRAWDRMIPLSRLTDKVIAPFVGRSVVLVWDKPSD